MKLDWIRSRTVDSLTKGIPPLDSPLRLDGIGAMGWNILAQDLPLPVAVIRRDVMEAIRRWMRSFLDRFGVELCPHGKTTMSPELFALQMADGAFGMTCATASHLEVYRAVGIPRVIVANQLVGECNLAMALRHLRAWQARYFLRMGVAHAHRLVSARRTPESVGGAAGLAGVQDQ